MHAAAASSAMPPTCDPELVRYVNVDVPSTAPLSNAVVETSPLLFTLEASALRAAAAAAGRRVAAALRAASAHACACAPLCGVLCGARAIGGRHLEAAYHRGEVDVDGLRRVFEKIESFQQAVDRVEVCFASRLWPCADLNTVRQPTDPGLMTTANHKRCKSIRSV